jgi:DNA polymerase I
MSEKKLFLLDAMALIYRAYFALSRNPRINSKGLNTSAVLGFANTLLDLLQTQKPSHIGVAFDLEGPTVRHLEYSEYKANREAMPEELVQSLPYIRSLISGFRIPILQMPGYEADDVIGTLARKAEEKGFTTYMVTPDKDFGQLVSEKTQIYKPGKLNESASILGIKEVCERFGINKPSEVIDILGLWGDASDNIPGVPGIGEKTAGKLIAEYGSIENLISNAGKLKDKLRDSILANAELALRSKELARIITNVDIPFDEQALLLKQPDEPALRSLFAELEFRTYQERIARIFNWGNALSSATATNEAAAPVGAKSQAPASFDLFNQPDETGQEASHLSDIQSTLHDYKLITDAAGRAELIGRLTKLDSFCFDTETTGLDVNSAELVGIAFSWEKGKAFFVHLPDDRTQVLAILEEFRPLFGNQGIIKVGQNLKYDISVLANYGIEVTGALFDTMIAHYLLEPDMRHGMDYLAETYLQYSPVPIEQLIGRKGKTQISMRLVDLMVLKEYACEDADITWQLKELFEQRLKEFGLKTLFDEVEMPLITVLSNMERAGVKLDVAALREYSQQLGREIIDIEEQIYEQAGTRFNIGSPKQLGEIIFERLRISGAPKMTKTKQYATSEEVLAKLAHRHPVIDLVLEYRSLTKLKSTYLDSLPDLVHHGTGLIHTSYNQAVAATGRLSSQNPNLQNIPIRSDKGREIRRAFIPRSDGRVLLAADYSQIELRLIAELSGDQKMLADFSEGRDIHTATAARVYGIPLEMVSKEMRRNAKTVNFGIIYGISAFGLAERLNIPRTEAASIIENYFREYPGIKAYMNESINRAREQGFVETILGRRRYLRDIRSANAVVRGFAERNAINAPIQGSSADMIKVAMIRIFGEMKSSGLQSLMIMQVHDELVFDVPTDEVDRMKDIIHRNMVDAIPLKVAVEVEMSTGLNWLEAH